MCEIRWQQVETSKQAEAERLVSAVVEEAGSDDTPSRRRQVMRISIARAKGSSCDMIALSRHAASICATALESVWSCSYTLA